MESFDLEKQLEQALFVLRDIVSQGHLTFVPRGRLLGSLAHLEMTPRDAERVILRLTSDDFLYCPVSRRHSHLDVGSKGSGGNSPPNQSCEGVWAFSATCPCGEVMVEVEIWRTNSRWQGNCRCFDAMEDEMENLDG